MRKRDRTELDEVVRKRDRERSYSNARVLRILCYIIPLIVCMCLVLRVSGINNIFEQNDTQRRDIVSDRLKANGFVNTFALESGIVLSYDIPDKVPLTHDSRCYIKTDTEGEITDGESLIAGRHVYLTFDDSPSSNTAEILDILSQYNVKATFFVIGKDDEESRELIGQIAQAGHTVGVHSFYHKYSQIYESEESFTEDITLIKNFVYDITGEMPIYYRFPGGSDNKVSNTDMSTLIDISEENGLVYYDYNVSSGDTVASSIDEDVIYNNVIEGVKKNDVSVVLMHDAEGKNATVEALPDIIETLLDEGAIIEAIDENAEPIRHKITN